MSTNDDEKRRGGSKREKDSSESDAAIGREEGGGEHGEDGNGEGECTTSTSNSDAPPMPTENERREAPAGAADNESGFLAEKLAIAARSDAVRQGRARRRKQDEESSRAAAGTCVALGTAAGATASNNKSSGTDGKKQADVDSRITGPKTAAAEAAFRARRKGAATAASKTIGGVKGGKAPSRPETISADEPPPPPGHAHSASRANRALLKEAEEEKEEIVPSDSMIAVPAGTDDDDDPNLVRMEGADEDDGEERRSSGRRNRRDDVRERMATQEGGGTGAGAKAARTAVEEAEGAVAAAAAATANHDSSSENEHNADGVAVGTAAGASVAAASVSREVRPGAVAVPGPDAGNYGTTRTETEAVGTDDDANQGSIALTAFVFDENDDPTVDREGGGRDESNIVAATVTAVESNARTCCGIDCVRFAMLLAALCVMAAIAMGVMAATGAFDQGNRDSQSPTLSPTTSPMPSSAPTECKPPSTKLLPNEWAGDDEFGGSVAVYGDTAIVGAPYDDDNGYNSGSGSAYLFTRTGTEWVQQAKLLPDDGAAGDRFGYSVAVYGNTAIVGAPWDDDNGRSSGSAYIFTRTGTEWVQQAKLLPDDGAADDRFGYSVALYGDIAIVGAPWDDDNGVSSGSAYIFTRAGTDWAQQAKLLPDDGASDNNFGRSVAVYGDTAIVGAYGNDDNGDLSGSACIFTRTGTDWVQQAKLLPDDGAPEDWFGTSVAVYGDTAIVGAHGDDDNGDDSGSAYVFTRTGTEWEQQVKLLPDDGAAGDSFGWSVSLDGDTAVIGASGGIWGNDGGRSVYVFTRSGKTWEQQKKLLPDDGAGGDRFGSSVAVNGTTVFVGARRDDDNGEDSGSVYAFELC